MNAIFLPLAILLIVVCPIAMVHGIFYNKTTKEWRGKRWQHNTVYAISFIVYFYLCTLPLMPGVYNQIRNLYDLAAKKTEFIELQSESVPDTEFMLVYEVLRSTSPEELTDDILPQIIEYQGRFSEWHVFDEHDYRIENYSIHYDSEKKLYLLYLNQGVAAEIEIKNTWFFKKIYFHGYWTVYQSYQKEDIK